MEESYTVDYSGMDDRDELWAVIQAIPDVRIQQIIISRYGLNGGKPQTFAEIGAEWGITREKARLLFHWGVDLLRDTPAERLRGLFGVGDN